MFQVITHHLTCSLSDRDDSFFGTFPQDSYAASIDVDLRYTKTDKLRHSKTRSIQQFQHHAVALILDAIANRQLQQRRYLL